MFVLQVTGLGQVDGSIQVLNVLQVQAELEDPFLPRYTAGLNFISVSMDVGKEIK